MLHGPKRSVFISPINLCDVTALQLLDPASKIYAGGHDGLFSVAAPLIVEVQDFVPRENHEDKYILAIRYQHTLPRRTRSIKPEFFAIPEESLPSLETIQNWVLDATRRYRRAFVGGFYGSFLSLARRYCECERELPLVSVPKLIMHFLVASA